MISKRVNNRAANIKNDQVKVAMLEGGIGSGDNSTLDPVLILRSAKLKRDVTLYHAMS